MQATPLALPGVCLLEAALAAAGITTFDSRPQWGRDEARKQE